MIRIVFIICETLSITTCEERVHDFLPATPVVCAVAAVPELAGLTPEGWGVDYWCCGGSDAPTAELRRNGECRNGGGW